MSEKPKSALSAMLNRVITRSDALHEELHEFDDELSHHVSHLLKKIAKLTGYVEIEVSDRGLPEVESLIARNIAEIQADISDLLEDAQMDPAIHAVTETISKLVIIMTTEWNSPSNRSSPTLTDAENPRNALETFEHMLNKLTPTARADIAVRHSYLALREMAKFWRANDDQLANLNQHHENDHDYEHNHGHKHDHGNI
ncbi:MAG: hypothetical protein RBG13Loki_1837 [Promethearchaeota archaeon CR_4]|nr:MAG: hypothetical protein RBG13Loki_1837 [Candidatus Lokiarchaeota archaeon CR_4]